MADFPVIFLNKLPFSSLFFPNFRINHIYIFFESVHGYSWVYEDCELLVTALCPSLKPLSRFRFDRLLHEKNLNIACVAEFAGHGQNNHDKASQSKYKVLVSLTRDIPNAGLANCSSWLVLLDVRLHQVIRVIDCPFRIVKIEPISLAHQIQAHNLPLNEHIKHSDGLVALGTSTGVINLIDLQLDGWRPDDDRSTPYRLHVLHPDSLAQENWSLESKRRLSEMNHQLICVPLNSDSQYKGQFLYQQSQGEYETIPFDQVEIGALRYFVQTNTLYVGFSFGGFQGWSLQTLQIVFGCQLEQYLTPVIGFSLQEPENDPCNYCYLWVMRGCADQGAIEYQDCIYSSASLFVFEYDQKQWTKDFGYMYSRLVSEGIRFEYYMTSTPYSANVDSTVGGGSTLIAHGTLPKSVPSSTLNQYGDMDEECLLMDSSLFYFVWEAFDNQFENITRYLAIFDLNQWYQSQIPAALQLETAASFSPYICFYKLSRLESKGPIRSLLDAKIDANQVERYPHRAYSNEIAYYPCSLSFSVYFLTETQTIESNFVGLQSSCLSALRQDSRSVLLEPSEFLSRCLFSGLLSSDSIGQLNTLDKRREAVLTLALEHDQLPFLLATIEWWAEETIADTGCSVKFFLNWLWKQVAATKNSIDQLIEVLFDPTPDAIGLRSLRSQRILLGNLRSLLKGLINCGAPNTAQGERELVERLSIVDCIFDYTRVVMWLYGCDLLQSHSMCESIDWIQTYEQLQSNCDRRRTNARTIDSACAGQELLIDSLLKHTPEVSKMWREHGSSGHYPPTNLHSIVSIYLIESLPIELKHEIMLYHLYDLVSLLEQTHPEVVHKILTFPLYFSLRSDLTRLVESLSWFDREEILNATSLLRTSSLRLAFPHELYDYKSLEDDLQVRIVRLFLAHKCTHQAYRFMNSALFNCDSLIKQQLYIKVLMQSKNVLAAFKFQKQHRSQTNGEQLLYQLFLDCEELALFDKVFKLTLDQVEEQALICYLLDVSKSLKSRFLLVIYFMVRERPFEGADVLQSIRNEIDLIQDESTYQKAVELKSLVDAYLNTSPPFLVQMRTINSQLQSKSLESVTTRRLRSEKGPQPVAVLPEATLNTPLSAFVANLFQQIESIEQIAPKPNIATPFSKRYAIIHSFKQQTFIHL